MDLLEGRNTNPSPSAVDRGLQPCAGLAGAERLRPAQPEPVRWASWELPGEGAAGLGWGPGRFAPLELSGSGQFTDVIMTVLCLCEWLVAEGRFTGVFRSLADCLAACRSRT